MATADTDAIAPGVPSAGALALARDGAVLEADAEAWRILGAKGAQDARELRIADQVAAAQRGALELLLDRVFQGGAAALELELSGLDGVRRRVEAHAAPLRDPAGPVRAAQLTLHDLTGPRREPEAPDEGNEEFRVLAENVLDNVVLYDRACRAVYVNGTMRNGSAPDIVPVVGLSASEQSPGVPWAREYQHRIEEALATGRTVEMEAPIRNRAGELRTDHVVIAPIRGGGGVVVGAIAIGRDITERKASEASVRKLSLAVEQSPASIVITDTGGRIEYVNAKFAEVTGYSAAEALGQNPRILKSNDTPPEVYRELWQTITAGKVWRGEFHNRKKSGELYWELASISPVFSAQGTITHYVAVKEDITERKRLEEGLRQAQKMDAIGRLAGGVAHDFNNLLTVIETGAVQLREGGLGQEDGNELLDQISEAAERAARLTRQLLTFSHRRPAQRVDLDLNELARSMSRMLGRIIGEQITFTEEYAPEGAPVHADPGMMEQVILNLVVNARDAMPAGGQLSIRTEVVRDPGDRARAAPGGHVVLAVRDTGAGIPPEHQAHLFEPFFTTKGIGKGTGLGLAVVFGIVEQHGGHIEVRSDPGKGSTFRIWLPLLQGPVPARTPPPVAHPSGGTETVLVVEDELPLQRMVQRVLQGAGYHVYVASSAAAAMALWAEHRVRIDLLLTDLVMPGMGGRELAEQLRADEPSLRVLYTTGYSGDTLGAAAALRDVLEKPYGPAEILARVRAALDQG